MDTYINVVGAELGSLVARRLQYEGLEISTSLELQVVNNPLHAVENLHHASVGDSPSSRSSMALNANVSYVARAQAPCLALVRPADWCLLTRPMHKFYAKWQFPNLSQDEIVARLVGFCNGSDRFEFVGWQHGLIVIYFFTPGAAWLDVCELELFSSIPKGCIIHAYSRSTSCCPATVPCAVLGGATVCWCPFKDWGENEKHLEVSSHGITTPICKLTQYVRCRS